MKMMNQQMKSSEFYFMLLVDHEFLCDCNDWSELEMGLEG